MLAGLQGIPVAEASLSGIPRGQAGGLRLQKHVFVGFILLVVLTEESRASVSERLAVTASRFSPRAVS